MTYSTYKKSNIPWIGNIPEHWIKQRIKDCLTFKIGGTPPTKTEEYFEGENIWVSIADISKTSGDYIYDSSIKINDEAVRNSNVKLIKKGSLLYSFKLSVGLTTFAGCDLYTNEAIASFEPNNTVDLNYLKYVFQAGFENNAAINIYGAKLFNSDLIKFAKFVMPDSIEEQKQIANYLDKKTAKIDETIAKNEELIQLLEEKRVALINEVVTKGLNPDVAMKDSGVEWIGEIPEHWNLTKFRNVLKERSEKNNPIKSKERLSLSIDKGVTLYSEKTTNLDRFKDDFTQYKLAHEGDLVLNSMNMIVGAVGVSPYFGCVSPVYYTYYDGTEDHIVTTYCDYLFKTKTIKKFLRSLGRGIMSIDRGDDRINTCRLKVSRDDLRNMYIPYPPLNEQKQINQYLDEECERIANATYIINKHIALLQEYKTSLIHHVVTGKIDVRGEEI